MTWNYRVLQSRSAEGEFFYQFHEVYYQEDGKATGYGASSASLVGNTPAELASDLVMLRRALLKPVLSTEAFPAVVQPGLGLSHVLMALLHERAYPIKRFVRRLRAEIAP